MSRSATADCIIIGGGFYGCCLAWSLAQAGQKVVLLEARATLLDRASRVNQARVHSGFHYPRNALTAVKSMALHHQFAQQFPDAVVDDFQMLYAIARRGSKIGANRFLQMFRNMGAPIQPADGVQAALFDTTMVEAVFACTEWAFDHAKLRAQMERLLDASGVDVRLGSEVTSLREEGDRICAGTPSGEEFIASHAFNVTYARLNDVLEMADQPKVAMKYEFTEICLVEAPALLKPYGITVMDGPFFSAMPWPAEGLHSLSHVRYTPHFEWQAEGTPHPVEQVHRKVRPETRFGHMVADARRFVPALAQAEWKESLYEVKAVLPRNERDDGRPIFIHRASSQSRLISVLGAKIDNIFDLVGYVRSLRPEWAEASDQFGFALHDAGEG